LPNWSSVPAKNWKLATQKTGEPKHRLSSFNPQACYCFKAKKDRFQSAPIQQHLMDHSRVRNRTPQQDKTSRLVRVKTHLYSYGFAVPCPLA
jgi:hypothetical protein